jgi:hypothetical protein
MLVPHTPGSKRFTGRAVLGAAFSAVLTAASGAEPGAAAASGDYKAHVAPLVERFCVECHGANDPEAGLSLAGLTPAVKTPVEIDVWKLVLDRLDSGQMPPIDAAQPSREDRGRAMAWMKSALRAAGERIDELKPLASSRGNRVDHDELFSTKGNGPAITPGRVWRVSDRAYMDSMKRIVTTFNLSGNLIAGDNPRIRCPWSQPEAWDFGDFSSAHRLTEAETELHVVNCSMIARELRQKRSLPALEGAVAAGQSPPPEAIEAAVREAFTRLLRREAGAADVERYGGFLTTGLGAEDPSAGEMFIVAVLSHPDVLYRVERPGEGATAIEEPRQLARSLALTLTDREPDEELRRVVEAGGLRTAADVRVQVQRILDDGSIAKPRITQFFREYFDYTPVGSIFKDTKTSREHRIIAINCGQGFSQVIPDTDALVAWAVAADRQVLRTLLTTPKVFVLSQAVHARNQDRERKEVAKKKDAERAAKEGKPFNADDPKYAPTSVLPGNQWMQWTRQVYGFMTTDEWRRTGEYIQNVPSGFVIPYPPTGIRLTEDMFEAAEPEPINAPPGQRMGMLTQPAWLISQSGNFDNHPIHRGRWIREKLLGGVIPDVPITVNAMLPNEPHHSLRERMRVTREEYCWNCHRLMDPLGLPFEQYDHYGRFRTAEVVEDATATAATRAKNLEHPAVMRTIPFETTGAIEASGDPSIDGPVKDPFELIEKLARSKRVEQVFVRHVFRFFLGRNETLADGPAIQAAHKAYVDSDGSLKALLVSLLSSEPFICRTGAGPADTDRGPAAPASAGNQPAAAAVR